MARSIRVANGSEEWTVELEGDRLRLDGHPETFAVSDLMDGRVRVESAASVYEGVAAVAGDTVWVGLDGEAMAFSIARAGSKAAPAVRDQDALTPPMSATVIKIHVAPGQRVHAGDALVVLEAMKMELPIRAPREGTVRAVRCAEGQLVEPGTWLVDLDG